MRVSILYNNAVHQVICEGQHSLQQHCPPCYMCGSAFFEQQRCPRSYMWRSSCDLLVCGGKLHDRIISVRRGVRTQKSFCWGICAGPREWRSYMCWGYSFCFCFFDFSIRIVNCSVGVIFFFILLFTFLWWIDRKAETPKAKWIYYICILILVIK